MTQPPADPNAQAPGPSGPSGPYGPGPSGPYGTQPPAGGTGAYPGRGAYPQQPAQGYPGPSGPTYPGQPYPGGQFQQQPTGQFGYDPRAGHRPLPGPPIRSGRAGKVLRILGAVLLAVGAALVGAFAYQVASVLPPASAMTAINGRTPVVVQDNVMQVIYATDPDTTCSVRGPGETPLDLVLDSSMSFTRDDTRYSAIGRIGGPDQDNGTYTVECDGPGVVVGPALNAGALVLGVVFAVAGFGLLIVALILLILGFVLRSSTRRNG